jgi:hypothetical protein
VAVRLQLKEPVRRETNFRLLLGNQPVLAQFCPAEPGNSVAGWWLDFPVDLLPYQAAAYRVEFGPQLPDVPRPKRGHKLLESDATFQIVNEPAIAWTVDRKLAGLLQSVRSGDLEYLRPDSLGLLLTDSAGNEHRMGGARADGDVTPSVIRNGPLAVGLRFELVERDPALAGVRSTVDLTFPVFKSWVEVEWRVDDPQGKVAGVAAQVALNLNEPSRSLPTLVDFGATSLVYASLLPGHAAALQSDPTVAKSPSAEESSRSAWEVHRGPSDRLEPFVFGPRPWQPDIRPEGWVHVMDRQRCLALAADGFARGSKDRISVSAEGAVRLQRESWATLADAQLRTKQLHVWLHFVPFPPQQTAATSPQAMQNPPLIQIRSGRDP